MILAAISEYYSCEQLLVTSTFAWIKVIYELRKRSQTHHVTERWDKETTSVQWEVLYTLCTGSWLFETQFCRLESESGVNSILITILSFWPTSWKDRTFCLLASFRLIERIIFKKICPKRTFPSDSVKLGSEIPYFFGRKNGRLFCFVNCLFICCNTLFRFWLTFLIDALIKLRKMLKRKKIFDVRLGNCPWPLRYTYSADLLDLQRCNRSNF